MYSSAHAGHVQKYVKGGAFVCAALLLCSVKPHPPLINVPKLILWAWERPEDLRFINPRTTGVAFLALTIDIQRDGRIVFKPRLQPLKLPPGIAPISVVRIETPARYILPDPAPVAEALRNIEGPIQIDFDASNSERPFYSALLTALRSATKNPVSMTALASWCSGDRWLDGQPISEAVPMLFRMGRGEFTEMPIRSRNCSSAVGVSMDEPWPVPKPGKRIYVFNPLPWTRASYADVSKRMQEWQ